MINDEEIKALIINFRRNCLPQSYCKNCPFILECHKCDRMRPRRCIMAFLMKVLWMPPGSVESALFLIDWLGNNPGRSWKEQQNYLRDLARI